MLCTCDASRVRLRSGMRASSETSDTCLIFIDRAADPTLEHLLPILMKTTDV